MKPYSTNCNNETKPTSTPCPLVASAKPQPNIIFILVDDLGYADVGFNGSKFVETPTTDPLESHNIAAQQPHITARLLNDISRRRTKSKVPLPPNSVVK